MGHKPIGDNEAFVTLMRVAQEDPAVKRTLTAILAMDAFQRKSMLNTLIQDMKLKGAARDFVSAIETLLDDDVAERAVEVIAK
jgi:hypothetical protein